MHYENHRGYRGIWFEQGTTQGYTDEELDGFNAELDALLLTEEQLWEDGRIPPDTLHELVDRFVDNVAGR